MSKRALVARAIADAFLAGDWSPETMLERAGSVIGATPAWLQALARLTASAPRPEPDALARAIAASKPFGRAMRAKAARITIRRWVIPELAMGGTPWEVPSIPTPGDLARWLELDTGELAWLADSSSRERRAKTGELRHYVRRWIERPGAAPRLLEAPKPRLKALQRRVLHEILDRVPAHAAAHGFVRGRSVRSFAEAHVRREIVIKMDLADFFASITIRRAVAVFHALGYPRPVARLLAGLATTACPIDVWARAPRPSTIAIARDHHRRRLVHAAPHLPQGAPTSPALANLVSFRLDRRLAALASSCGASYTRYADDLAFSGDADLARAAPRFHDLVARIVVEEGFAINARKTRMLRRAARQSLAGVVVNDRLSVPRAEIDRLKATLKNCAVRGPSTQNRSSHPAFREHLRGRIEWVRSLNPARGDKLLALFQAIDWSA